jgi:hypothetical protein
VSCQPFARAVTVAFTKILSNIPSAFSMFDNAGPFADETDSAIKIGWEASEAWGPDAWPLTVSVLGETDSVAGVGVDGSVMSCAAAAALTAAWRFT